MINEISKDDKNLLTKKFDEVYDSFKESIIKIICDDLKWCDVRGDIKSSIDYVRFIVATMQVILRSYVPGQVLCVVALFVLDKGPQFLDKMCNCDR